MMNRETSFRSSDTLIVTDRSGRRRWVIIGAVVILALLALGSALMMGHGSYTSNSGAAGGKGAGQIPTVTVVVPGSSQVTRVIVASGALGAKRDQPVGIAGQGGRIIRVTVDAGSWVRAGQVLA